MADYGVQVTRNTINASGNCVADCFVTVVAGTSRNELSTTVVVPFGASTTATNNNILAAAKTEAMRVFGITANQGGTDRQALFGGRST